jgi:hypothetical protein
MDTGYQINIRFFYPQKCSAFLGQKIALQFLRPENLMTISLHDLEKLCFSIM